MVGEEVEEEVQRLNVHAEVCMSSEGFQLSQTIGGGKVLLCMTIGSLTPVKPRGVGQEVWGGGRGGAGVSPSASGQRACVRV